MNLTHDAKGTDSPLLQTFAELLAEPQKPKRKLNDIKMEVNLNIININKPHSIM
jgi:hypothetical protein